ncbi:hypothetical protein JCM14076_06200 [Methylosoma difficile]
MKHFLIIEDSEDGGVIFQSLKQGLPEELARLQAGHQTGATLLANYLVDNALSRLDGAILQPASNSTKH